jgi:hypothetical protein
MIDLHRSPPAARSALVPRKGSGEHSALLIPSYKAASTLNLAENAAG